jgi:hypothetical protein
MKDRVDKSMGIVTHIPEALARIKPTESLRLVKREPRKKRNCSDSSGNSPAKIISSRCTCKKSSRAKSSNLHSGCLVEGTIRLRSTGGGYSVCERSVCMLCGTSIEVMSHCDIHHECTRRESIILFVWEDDIILDLDVTPFIVRSRSYSMGFNSVTNRT